jgi:hypothetical protein
MLQARNRTRYRLMLHAVTSVMIALGFISGCTVAPTPPRTVTLSCRVPVIVPQPETKESQEKGGIEITVAPLHYTAEVRRHEQVRPVPPPPISVYNRGDTHVEITSTPTVAVSPGELRFLVTINNKLSRVFHGAGTVVQFNVGGRLQAVDQAGYSNILGAIIPPQQQQQIEIVGPSLSTLTSDTGIIGVFLYDVVTGQNEAGVVTEKQNFQWYFDYTVQTHELTADARAEQRWMGPIEYREALIRQAAENARPFQSQNPQYANPSR